MDENNKEIVKHALMFIGAIAVLKVIVSSLLNFYIILFPLTYVYLLQTCPSVESFEAKKELKRVLRGKHLPDDHPTNQRVI